MKQYFCAGTYNTPILFGTGEIFCGTGKGLSICAFEDGVVSVMAEVPIENPSYLCIDEQRRRIYAVNELKEYQGEAGGGVTELSYEETGKISVVNSFCTGGADPCHVLLSPNKDYLLISNYASGSLTVFPLDQDGHILPRRKVFQHSGHSVHPERQRGPHAHSTVFYGKDRLFTMDLGADCLMAYRIGKEGVQPDYARSVQVSLGSGPRWGEFSKDCCHFYLVNELSASVTHFRVAENGQFIPCQTLPGFPQIDSRVSDCADLHITPDGRFLYLSIRGHNSISSFRIGREGELSWMENVDCGGKTPRNFAITPDGGYLLAANQDSDTIAAFSIGEDGHLALAGKTSFPTPVCIRFFASI